MFHVKHSAKGITDGNRFKGNDGNGRSGNRLWGTAPHLDGAITPRIAKKAGGNFRIESLYEGEQLKQCIVCREDCQS